MEPIQRPYTPIFAMDEDIQAEFDKTYQLVRTILLNNRSISTRDISSLFHVNNDMAYKIMDKIKMEFINRGTYHG